MNNIFLLWYCIKGLALWENISIEGSQKNGQNEIEEDIKSYWMIINLF
jgi:hypothetical protein